MTLFQRRAALYAVVLAAVVPGAARAQRTDSYTWKIGVNAGIMAFQTRAQDTKVIPSAGAHLLVMARRGGLMVGVDEGIGSNEGKKAGDYLLFNDVRRYQAVMMAFPISGPIEPYFGGGGGILTVVGPRIDSNLYPDPTDRAVLLADAKEHSASGFLTFVGGIQGRAGRYTLFAQYEATTSPSDDKILKGAGQTLLAGLRVGLG
ncbi:MAG: hypothetical protein ACREL5_07440 [Gemmatimonadales bacterium]